VGKNKVSWKAAMWAIVLLAIAASAYYCFYIADMPLNPVSFIPLIALAAGLALIFKKRLIAAGLLIMLILCCGIYVAGYLTIGDQREIVNQIAAGSGIERVNLDVSYGAGTLTLHSGESSHIITHTIKTADAEDPETIAQRNGSTGSIQLRRKGSLSAGEHNEKWDIALSPEIIIDAALDYGAADAFMDLSNLKVERLDVKSGATESEIIFAAFPTKALIETGASSIRLKFPKGYGASITVEGGLLSQNFEGFTKDGNTYSIGSPNSSIEVMIKAGAASLTAEFY
jgi:hypothetical protein